MGLGLFCLFKSENGQSDLVTKNKIFPQAVFFAEKDGISGCFCYFCNPKPGIQARNTNPKLET
jgi:hypothetical protein